MQLLDVVEITRRLVSEEPIDFVDVSAWDVYKKPTEEVVDKGDMRLLIEHFTGLPRGPRNIPIGVAGKISNVEDIAHCMKHGADFVSPGRASILQHDFPAKIAASVSSGEAFVQPMLPVTQEHLMKEGVSPVFATYLRNWPGFVKDGDERAKL
mmetsp:Transcript_67378/g.219493  ORF Transcript_67378/g.219493 Transcript_67378/m.219493 type:complete len:153 (+) Transcript_67378:79-537(+)